MLETNNSRIDIDKLESQVKWDARRYAYLWLGSDSLRPMTEAEPDPAPADLSESIAAAAAFSNVESPTYTLQRYGPPLRWLASAAARTVLYLARIITHAQTHFNYRAIAALDTSRLQIESLDKSQQRLSGILSWLSAEVPHLGDSLEGSRSDQADLANRLTVLESRMTQADKERVDHGGELEKFRTLLPALQAELEAATLKLGQQAARISLQERLLQELGRPVMEAEAVPPAAVARDTSGDDLAGLYMVFEDHFRGSREAIRERLGEYLPLVDQCLENGAADELVVDLGCGRGEWLELLGERGIKARGIDSNAGFLSQCEESGLDVVGSDVLEYLSALPDASVAVVSGFHIIEHLEFDVMVRLIDQARRVLREDGLALFETPNPRNLIVGACNFYADPTHVRQVFPELLEFVMQSRGFRSVELRYLNPHPPEQRLSSDEAPILAGQLNDLLSCARDFAVVARK